MAGSIAPRTYEKLLGTGTAIKGHELEIHLLIFAWLKAKAVKNVTSFEIASNVKGTGCFDDVVVKCEYKDREGIDRKHLLFLQAKHISNPESKPITTDSLENERTAHKKNFLMSKYYEGFSEIVKSTQNLFSIKFDDIVDNVELIIYTNGVIEEGLKNSILEIDTTPSIIDMNNGAKYKLTERGKTEFGESIKTKFELEETAMSDVQCFLNNIIFLVEQPSLENLKKLNESYINALFSLSSSHEINEIFNKAEKKFKKIWEMNGKCEYLTQNMNFYLESWLEHCDAKQKSDIKKKKIEFNQEYINSSDITKTLQNSASQITEIITSDKCFELSAAKMLQTIQSLNETDFIFIDAEDFTAHVQEISDLFENSDQYKKLIILVRPECKNVSISNIFTVLATKENKFGIILHSNRELNPQYDSKKTLCNQLQDQSFTFNQFPPQFKSELLSYEITVQKEKKMKLGEILLDSSGKMLLPDCEHSDIILKFIHKRIITLGKKNFGLNEIEKLTYIKRELLRSTELDKRLFHKTSLQNDIVVVKIADKKTAESYIDNSFEVLLYPNKCGPLKNIYFCLETVNIEELSQQNQGNNTHVLEMRAQTLHWLHTHASMRNIIKYFLNESDSIVCQTESDFCEYNETKNVIISDSAGTGKTTVLKHIAELLSEKYQDSIIIAIPLNIYTQYFDNKTYNMSDEGEVIDFLCLALGLKKNIQEQNMFKCLLIKEKVIIILDSFDEISPKYEEDVLALIKTLINLLRVKQMWIACRPHLRSTLQETLNTVCYSLKEISKKEKIEYIVNIFKKNYITKDSDELHCKYAIKIIDKIDELGKKQKQPMSSIILHLHMMAHIFSDRNDTSLRSENEESDISLICLADMYCKFINKKYLLCFTEKMLIEKGNQHFSKSQDFVFRALNVEHQYVAMKLLLGESQINGILHDDQKYDFDNTISRMDDYSSYGLFEIIDKNEVKFLHQTIAEYFVACVIHKKLKYKTSEDFNIFLIYELFENDKFNVVRSFLNDLCKIEPVTLINNLENVSLNKIRINDSKKIIKIFETTFFENNEYILCLFLLCFKSKKYLQEILFDSYNSDSKGECLMQLALENTNNIIIKLLTSYINVNHTFSDKDTMLHKAAKKGNIEIVKHLVEKGGNVNASDSKGETVLHIAAYEGNSYLLEYLVQKGADVKAVNDSCMTVLHCAGIHCNLDTIKYLVEAGADINATKYNALLFSATTLNTCSNFVEHLIKRRVNVKVVNEKGMRVLHWAIDIDDEKFRAILYLVEHVEKTKAKSKDGETFLHKASWHYTAGLVECWKFFEKYHKSEYQTWMTVLEEAVIFGNFDIVKCLVELGAGINAKSENIGSVLNIAACFGNADLVEYLVQRGADVTAVNVHDLTVLHYAVKYCPLDTVKYLVEHGAGINAKSKYIGTVLNIAACHGNADLVEYLVQKGADVKAVNDQGMTVLHWAVKNCTLDTIKYLVERGADIKAKSKVGETFLDTAAFYGKQDLVEYSVQKGADVKAENKDGMTVLHQAVKHCTLDTVKYLVERGADIKAKSKDGKTILHIAAWYGNSDLVEYLVQQGADVKAVDRQGMTVLHQAVILGPLDTVKYLVEHGADIKAKRKDGLTVLHGASWNGNADVVEYLVQQGITVTKNNHPSKNIKYGKLMLNVFNSLVDPMLSTIIFYLWKRFGN